ncbi:FixH family protein [Comamonas granuli]|uniref:FixH family protein n=1 Tax=Comamonas granuli TaxID=290309 RepID=UPI0005AA9BA5|nr:FixH family protein [Comamonas granuli]
MSEKLPLPEQHSGPWWKYGYVWLIVSGPLAVILAAVVTLWFILRTPDPVIAEDYYRRGVDINKTLEDTSDPTLPPALKGRNHAATPVQDRPR